MFGAKTREIKRLRAINHNRTWALDDLISDLESAETRACQRAAEMSDPVAKACMEGTAQTFHIVKNKAARIFFMR